ncbi:MAG: transglutaminase-like domain-containing protein [Candidatus Hodarchaeales archaeon]|jgi:hypothetical protein
MDGKKSIIVNGLLLVFIMFLSGCTQNSNSENISDQDPYNEEFVDWSPYYNTPTWDGTYLEKNILDQFTAGLRYPDMPLFYIKSDQMDSQEPLVYWRLGSLEKYEYLDRAPYTTNWDNTEDLKRTLTPIQSSTPYSQEIPENERSAQFTIRLPLDYSDSIADVSIHPYFNNYLPTIWNGEFGSYVDSDTFKLYDYNSSFDNPPFINGALLTASYQEAREIFPMVSTNDLLGIEANIQGLAEKSDDKGVMEYKIDYKAPDVHTSTAFSLKGTDQDYIHCLSSPEWNALKSIYLQLPNDTGQLPDPSYVHDGFVTNDRNNYEDWAPNVAHLANSFKMYLSDRSIFGKAYGVLQQFVDGGNLSHLTFSQEMWLRQQISIEMAHPEEYEDYNEWFLCNGKGVSIHFASLYTTIMRLMGIPSRMVIGFLGGNDSLEYYPYRMISPRYLHAWSEVLIPIEPVNGEAHVEWVSFDPLLAYFANLYDIDLPSDIIPTSTEAQTLMIDPMYDLETNGLAQAFLDNNPNDFNDWIIQRCVVDQRALGGSDPPPTIHHLQAINISVRLISAPSIASWLPVEGVNISFYIATVGANESIDLIEEGSQIGWIITNSMGIATLSLSIDITIHGIRTVNFYTMVIYNRGAVDEIRRVAMSFSYVLAF